MLVSEDEARNTVEVEDMYVIQPSHPWWQRRELGERRASAGRVPLRERHQLSIG